MQPTTFIRSQPYSSVQTNLPIPNDRNERRTTWIVYSTRMACARQTYYTLSRKQSNTHTNIARGSIFGSIFDQRCHN